MAEFYSRQQVIVKCLTTFVAAAGIPLPNEVHFDGRERPADVFIDRWTTPDPEAVDVTVTHPLADLFLTREMERGGHPRQTHLCRKQLVEKVQVALLHEVGKRLLAGIQADEREEDWRSRTVNAVDLP